MSEEKIDPGLEQTNIAPNSKASDADATNLEVDSTIETVMGSSPDDDFSVQETTIKPADASAQDETVIEAAAVASGKKTSNQLPALQLGDYRLIKKLGQGGMGEVFLAEHIRLERKVAIKTLKPELSRDKPFVDRFYREARLMARLDHPNIVRCDTVGDDPDTNIQYVAIEFIDGKSLQDWLDERGTIDVRDAVTIAIKVSEALAYAHSVELIHRDIKPDNILISKTGDVKVSDLGLAKALDERISMTQSGYGMGTPLYMPPEQARNAKHVDHRADIYALGTSLYHIITGTPPFGGQTTIELLQSKEEGFFKPIRKFNPNLPERLDLILDKMMAAKPDHRYSTWEEVIADLKSLGLDAGRPQSLNVKPDQLSSRRRPSQSSPSNPVDEAYDRKKTRVAKTSEQTEVTSTAPLWTVCYQGKNKKVAFEKLTTAELRTALSQQKIPSDAEVQAPGETRFRPISQCQEFQAVATQMSAIKMTHQAMRDEEKKTRKRIEGETKGPIYEHTWFLGGVFFVVVAGLTWMLWPLSDNQLMAKAELLYSQGDISQKRIARSDYLTPLLDNYPNSPLVERAKSMLDELESEEFERQLKNRIRLGKEPSNESERLVVHAWDCETLGDRITAVENYEAIIQIHKAADLTSGPALSFARRRAAELKAESSTNDSRYEIIRKTLKKADQQHQGGKTLDATTLWTSVITLYSGNKELSSLVMIAQKRLEGDFDVAIPASEQTLSDEQTGKPMPSTDDPQ